MARDRKRAKQRRARRGGAPPEPPRQAAPEPGEQLDDGAPAVGVPGALEHASAEVDEFDAALVRGARGVAATPELGVPEAPVREQPDGEQAASGRGAATGAEEELALAPGDGSDGGEGEPPAGGDGSGDGRDSDGGAGGGERERPGAPERGGNRALAFLRASWAELQRVHWPDRRQVTQATAVVLGFVAIAGVYLGIADYVAKEIVEVVLS